MILIVIFVLIFLIGFSLFAAVLGTSFLGKHAGRVVKTRKGRVSERSVSEREIAERFKAEYKEGIVQTAGEGVTIPPGELQPPAAVRYAQPVRTGRGGMWVLISLGIAAVLVFSFLFGYPKAARFVTEPRLVFCEGVDYLTQKPENRSNTFTRGNVTLFLRSRKPLGMISATVKITRIGKEGVEEYDRRTIPIRPGWTSFSLKALFDRTGTYEVAILEEEGGLIDRRVLYIVPDSYAYKPVPK
ncbi:MAG: hypothetical protein JXQ30_04585 [Spirochaetes bacterium]|nr:hypothetical protein [Spirochaetota bacterium]